MSLELVLMAIILAFVLLFLFEHQLDRVSGRKDLGDKIEERIVTRALVMAITAIVAVALIGYAGIDLKKDLIMVLIGAFAFQAATIIENELELRRWI